VLKRGEGSWVKKRTTSWSGGKCYLPFNSNQHCSYGLIARKKALGKFGHWGTKTGGGNSLKQNKNGVVPGKKCQLKLQIVTVEFIKHRRLGGGRKAAQRRNTKKSGKRQNQEKGREPCWGNLSDQPKKKTTDSWVKTTSNSLRGGGSRQGRDEKTLGTNLGQRTKKTRGGMETFQKEVEKPV